MDSVMTADPVTVTPDVSFKEAAKLLSDHGVSALPVLDVGGRLIGVVSEADLVRKEEFRGELDRHPPVESTRRHEGRRKAHAGTVSELMTSPVITVQAGTSITEAARVLANAKVRRVFVVDAEQRLVGVVARRDLLRYFLRDDSSIHDLVAREVFLHVLLTDPARFDIRVADGVVTLGGRFERHRDAALAVRLTQALPGVVSVVNNLEYDFDDERTGGPAGVG